MGRGRARSEPHGESPLVSACPWVLAHSHSDSASSSHSPKEYARHTDSPACKPGRWPRLEATAGSLQPEKCCHCHSLGDDLQCPWRQRLLARVPSSFKSRWAGFSLCCERPSERLLSCTQFIVSARGYFRVREFATRQVFDNWLCTA